MRDQIFTAAMALMHGLVMKTGGFGTRGDVERAFDVAETMYAEQLKREPKWREMAERAERLNNPRG